MRFASFRHQGRAGWGAISRDGMIDLSARHAAVWPTLRQVIEAGALYRSGAVGGFPGGGYRL